MPTPYNPLKYPAAYDAIFIGNQISPGVCRVSKTKRGHQWDIKRGKGALGSTLSYQGIEPSKFSIEFDLWQEPAAFNAQGITADFDLWDRFITLFRYDPTKKTIQAIEIYHPSLAQIGIHSVVVESVGNLIKKSPESMIWTAEVEFIEYLPPPAVTAVATPAGSQALSNTNPKTPPTPPFDPNVLLQQLQAQAQSPDG